MEWLERNLELLRRKDPDLTARIEQTDVTPDCGYVAEKARNGAWTVKARKDADTYVYLHSRYDPVREAEKVVENLELDKKDLVLVYGTGIGYHIAALRRRLKSGATFIIVEKDPALFKIWLGYTDWSGLLSGNSLFAVGEPVEKIILKLDPFFWNIAAHREMMLRYPPICDQEAMGLRDYYLDVRTQVNKETGTYVLNLNTMFRHAVPIQSNICANMPVLATHPGVSELFETCPGIPMIIVAAGPSLNKNIDLLKEAKGKIPIICVDTALKSLQAHDVDPDIVTAIDYSWKNYEKLQGVRPGDYYLASLPSVVPKTFEDFKEKAFVAYSTDSIYRWLFQVIGDKGVMPPGGSVVHLAFQLALRMGADPIIFTGLDLAYTGGFTHSADSIYHQNSVEEKKLVSFFKVEDVFGGTVYTPPNLWGIKTSLEHMIAGCGRKVIDASEGGARIEGTRICTLREALTETGGTEFNIAHVLRKAYRVPGQEQSEKLSEAVDTILEEIKEVKNRSEEGGTVCTRFKKHLRRKEYRSEKTRQYLDELNDKYNAILAKQELTTIIGLLVMKVAYDHTVAFSELEPGGKVTKKDMTGEIDEMAAFFTGLVDSCDIYIKLLGQVADDLAAGDA